MEASSLQSVRAFPSISSSSSLSRTLRTPQCFYRRPLLSVHSLRIFAAATEQGKSEGEDSRDGPSSSSFSGISAEELEQRLGKRSRARKDKPIKAADPKPAPKDWDSMTVAEKAWDVYVGEKGALFWLNKIAYAAIFVIVGGWIAFRFVGPALNLYQLESPLLPADQVFGGSK